MNAVVLVLVRVSQQLAVLVNGGDLLQALDPQLLLLVRRASDGELAKVLLSVKVRYRQRVLLQLLRSSVDVLEYAQEDPVGDTLLDVRYAHHAHKLLFLAPDFVVHEVPVVGAQSDVDKVRRSPAAELEEDSPLPKLRDGALHRDLVVTLLLLHHLALLGREPRRESWLAKGCRQVRSREIRISGNTKESLPLPRKRGWDASHTTRAKAWPTFCAFGALLSSSPVPLEQSRNSVFFTIR